MRWVADTVAAVAGSTSDSAAFSASSTASAAPADRDDTRTTLWFPASADNAHEYTKIVSTFAGGTWKTSPRGNRSPSKVDRVRVISPLRRKNPSDASSGNRRAVAGARSLRANLVTNSTIRG